ncbi:MAG: ParB/RepB/Spo0J family partition protein [Ruminococcus sp.]|uniref:ParB/RepB/Spo0J family partition protein n=1 Tax=Ruminococcus difficilis TaxID=2763069 RepID=A0A934WSV6_9FIRM|nr:ParB/RepB/Spo0J family partition protein [Ruminococcus difficilis]MBQ1350510.1 ParB/RepB/Spo0J family partition protein [Ruminococcus sp.]SCX09234.1 chromosome partitioning protein, ParB family [Ruminococcaceae bacterium P7]MBQ1616629.1 ParB/RepB/Spo0J family partition protein [Ruminococcus sp.]MBQ2469947.1 ParB/RepB/Spo0J family partition protein [Ruminococcus sp.]
MLIGVSGLNLLVRSENTIADIPIIKIRPNKAQPRKVFSEDELSALSRSISENGILQPLTVRKVSSTEYELVAGERRLRAAVMAGLRKVPCIVVKCSDRESAVYALLENLQRADLGIFEEARGIAKLIRRYGLTQEQAAIKLGKTQSTIANKLRLLRLSEEEQEWMEKAGLSERHARALIRIENETVRREVLSRIITENLNVKQSERLVGIYLNSTPKPSRVKGNSKAVIKDIRIFLNTINRAIDTMRLSGINAQSNKTDTEDFIEYTIRIPKSTLYSPDKSA